jgi:hypothetical protein
MMVRLRRLFARIAAGLVALVTLRLVEVNPTGKSTTSNDRDDDVIAGAKADTARG